MKYSVPKLPTNALYQLVMDGVDKEGAATTNGAQATTYGQHPDLGSGKPSGQYLPGRRRLRRGRHLRGSPQDSAWQQQGIESQQPRSQSQVRYLEQHPWSN